MAVRKFNEVDKFLVERWVEISELADAQNEVRETVEELHDEAIARLKDWGEQNGLEAGGSAKKGELWAFKKEWQHNGGDALVTLFVEGTTADALFTNSLRPASGVWCQQLKQIEQARQFRHDFGTLLRTGVGSLAGPWSDAKAVDHNSPLKRYLPAGDFKAAVEDGEKFLALVMAEFSKLSEFVKGIDQALAKMMKKQG